MNWNALWQWQTLLFLLPLCMAGLLLLLSTLRLGHHGTHHIAHGAHLPAPALHDTGAHGATAGPSGEGHHAISPSLAHHPGWFWSHLHYEHPLSPLPIPITPHNLTTLRTQWHAPRLFCCNLWG